jgi:nicotinamide mononucleotide adenylyltransferase
MKSFFQFLGEASQASMQAKKLNLKSDGHGGWLDSRGEFVAKTEDGKLKFFNQQQKTGEKDPDQVRTKNNQQPVATQNQPKNQEPEATKKAEPKPEEGGEGGGDTLTVTFGRFNPPTVGHKKLLDAAKKAAQGGELKVYPSRTQDPKKNPLDPDMKISYMKKMFPEFEENIVNDDEMRSIFNVLTVAGEQGYANVNIVVGSDRQAEFENLATKYNGELYNFENIRVISAGVRDADAAGVEGMSASKMRKAVQDDDLDSFRRGTPKELDDGDTTALFNAVRQGMGVKKKKKEVAEMWEIAPRYDQGGLRNQYVQGMIYRMGDIVESLHTGLIGEIVRRGTNHLICVTKENVMFKSWIRDVMEAVVNYPGKDGVPSDQREVGTDSYRKYAMRMTGTKEIKNFINKYKKKK